MLTRLRLRTIYALHMILPIGLVYWHVSRLEPETAHALWEMFR